MAALTDFEKFLLDNRCDCCKCCDFVRIEASGSGVWANRNTLGGGPTNANFVRWFGAWGFDMVWDLNLDDGIVGPDEFETRRIAGDQDRCFISAKTQTQGPPGYTIRAEERESVNDGWVETENSSGPITVKIENLLPNAPDCGGTGKVRVTIGIDIEDCPGDETEAPMSFGNFGLGVDLDLVNGYAQIADIETRFVDPNFDCEFDHDLTAMEVLII